MKWTNVLGIAVLVAAMVLYDWPKMEPHMKREKIAYVALVGAGAALAVLLVYNPELPGPTQLIEVLYRPVEGIVKKVLVERAM